MYIVSKNSLPPLRTWCGFFVLSMDYHGLVTQNLHCHGDVWYTKEKRFYSHHVHRWSVLSFLSSRSLLSVLSFLRLRLMHNSVPMLKSMIVGPKLLTFLPRLRHNRRLVRRLIRRFSKIFRGCLLRHSQSCRREIPLWWRINNVNCWSMSWDLSFAIHVSRCLWIVVIASLVELLRRSIPTIPSKQTSRLIQAHDQRRWRWLLMQEEVVTHQMSPSQTTIFIDGSKILTDRIRWSVRERWSIIPLNVRGPIMSISR